MKKLQLAGLLILLSNSLLIAQSININEQPQISDITTDGFTLSWATDSDGSTEAFWGYTPNLEQTAIKETGTASNHQLSIEGEDASTLIYIKVFSVSGSDTAFAETQLHITASGSSGEIKVYFNATVDTTKALTDNAIYVEDAIADTLANYISRAGKTVDMAIYNIDYYQGAKIIDALNDAHNRGVAVRVVYNESTSNSGISELDAAVGKIESPENTDPYGIMHNKFVIIDAESVDSALVWTGGTNFTSQQLNTDPNDVIILQDKSLAIAYTIEFNEMFGSTGSTPNSGNSKFGPDKADNTPHEFNIGGKRVELYFSPSDGTNDKIIDVINSADNELHIGTMLITRSDIALAITDKNEEGADTKMIIDDESSTTQELILVPSLGEAFRTMGETGIMHHKYMIVDHMTSDSDPQILTGCHNWSNSADNKNDENTLVVHDQNIANLYYQEFSVRYENGNIVASQPICNPDTADYTPDLTGAIEIPVLANDSINGDIILTITSETGLSEIEILYNNTVSYKPKVGFDEGIDTFRYSVCSEDYLTLCDDALVTVNVGEQSSSSLYTSSNSGIEVYPTSGTGIFYLSGLSSHAKISVINTAGQIIYKNNFESNLKGASTIDLMSQPSGIYYLIVVANDSSYYSKTIIIE